LLQRRMMGCLARWTEAAATSWQVLAGDAGILSTLEGAPAVPCQHLQLTLHRLLFFVFQQICFPVLLYSSG
jgi:hypothetical protein